MNSLEILDKKAILKDRAFSMIEQCKAEIRNFTTDELEEYNSIKKEITDLNEELRNINAALSPSTIINNNLNNTKSTMEKNFSLIKAIRSVSNNKALDNVSAAVVEAGAEEMRKAGLNYVGQIQLPSTEYRAVTVTDEGEDVVATNMVDLVKPLQAKNVMIQAGAKFVSGLVGDLQYPVMSACNTTWEGETATAKDGGVSFSSVKLSPKRLTCVVPVSKQFIVQDSVGAEMAIREEIINAINSKLEATILGSVAGSATQPAGLFVGTPSSVTSFDALCELEATAEESNVYGSVSYILSPKAKAALRSMPKGEGAGMVFANGEVDGTVAYSTSNCKDKNFAYGDFSQYIIAQWGNIDITVDNVTLAADGQIRLVVNAYFDAKPLRSEAIKVGKLA